MNNMMALFSQLANSQNPMMAMNQMFGSSPNMQRALQMMQGKDEQQMIQVVQNMCKQTGIDFNQLTSMFGIRL